MTPPAVSAVLVGYGYWGRRFLQIVGRVDALRVVGVVDQRVGEEGFPRPPTLPCHRDVEAAIEDADVEAVFVAVPAVGHADLVRRALLAGKHVFVEKPLAMRAVDAHDLLNLARARDLMLTVDHQYWWSAEVSALAAALAEGAVGPVRAVSAQRAAFGPVRTDVSAWWDLASHDVATLVRLGILGPDADARLRPTACTQVPDGDVAGCVVVSASSAAGVEVWLHACWMSDQPRRRLVITGERGSLCLEENDRALSAWLVRVGRRVLLSQTVKSDRGTPVERALVTFAEGVHGRRDLSVATDAAHVVDVLEQVATAAARPPAVVGAHGCWL